MVRMFYIKVLNLDKNDSYTAFHEAHTWLFFGRGDPGRRGGAVARELRRQPGWRLRDLQRVWWVQKGKRSQFIFRLWSLIEYNCRKHLTTHLSCDVLAPVLVLHSIPLSSVLSWKVLLKTVSFATVWGTICHWLNLSCLCKKCPYFYYAGVNSMLLNTNLC